MDKISAFERLSHLRLRHLALLDHVARLGSLSRVAEAVSLTQPAVTSMLKELEAAAGGQLVTRGRRGAVLTRKGELLLERFRHAREVLAGAGPLLDDAPAIPHLRIGVVQQAMLFLMPRAYASLRARGFELTLDVQELAVPECVRGILEGRLDCAITRLDPSILSVEDQARMHVVPLIKVPLKVVCGRHHPLARSRKITLAMLAEQQWVLHPRGTQVREAFEHVFFQAGRIPPRPTIESISFYSNFHLVAENRLITIAPATAVATYTSLQLIKSLPFAWPFELSPLNFVRLSHAVNPELEAMLDACVEVCAQGIQQA